MLQLRKVLGGMGAIDELRKAKGLDPIFLPKYADLIFQDTETEYSKQMKQKRY